MRFFLTGLLWLSLSFIRAEGFQVFEFEGLYGIKDDEGEVLVPAVYEELGWSNDQLDVFNEVIGFKKGNLWGLISIKNKILVDHIYHSLEPFGAEHLKASVKGKLSNQLFFGLLKLNGDVEISFNYSQLELVKEQIRASIYDNNRTKVGFLNFKNEKVIPLEFKVIEDIDQWLIAERFDQKKIVFDLKGKPIVASVDSVRQLARGLVCFDSGLGGFVNNKNKLLYDFKYKNFVESKGSATPIPFDTWEVFSGSNKIAEWPCDSLVQKGGFWIIYLNRAHHIVLDEEKKLTDHDLIDVNENRMIVRHSITGDWSVIDSDGETLFYGYGLIRSSGNFYFALKDRKWDLYNKFGSRVNKFPFDEIKEGVEGYFIAKRDDYWGVIDFNGASFLEFKYDSINLESQDLYSIEFFGKWGIMNKYGNWMINPNFQELQIFDRLAIGRRGALRSFFYDGAQFANLTFDVAHVVEGVPILEDSGRYGLINPTNSMLFRPNFDTVIVNGELMHFYKDDAIMLLHRDGVMKVDFEEGYEMFGEYGYGRVPVKKNGKWGFVDRQSRLRIANRYDEVRPFSQGFAAIKLKGKWGFIDTKENLVVQPFYKDVSPFVDGLSIFQTDDGAGLVNAHGKEVLSGWKSIERLNTGNFLIQDLEGQFGLVDKEGGFLLRPDFKGLEDKGEQVIVEKNAKMGVLDYRGNQLIKIGYSVIRKTDNYLVAKK